MTKLALISLIAATEAADHPFIQLISSFLPVLLFLLLLFFLFRYQNKSAGKLLREQRERHIKHMERMEELVERIVKSLERQE